MMNDDIALVRAYAAGESEEAFETLVGRYVNFVYSTALRQVRDPHLAEEITQAVFVILARKAGALGAGTILPSWLYRTAGYCAADALKMQRRRAQREQEAYMQSQLNEPENEAWPQIAPLLDKAIAGLNEKDRHAIVLRFFQNKSLNEIGTALGASEEAARKRVNRALEKLRTYFSRHGVNSTAQTLANAMSANSVMVAPATLAKISTAVALAKGATASASTLTLIKGALKVMAWTNAKTAIVVGTGLLLLAATTTVTFKKVHEYNEDSKWDTGVADQTTLFNGPRIVKIIPTRFPNHARDLVSDNPIWDGRWTSIGNGRSLGLDLSAYDVVRNSSPPFRSVFLTTLPQKRYDFIANVDLEAFQQAVKRQFGVVAQWESIQTNVLFLRVKNPNAPGLRPSTAQIARGNIERPGELKLVKTVPEGVVLSLEDFFKMPIVDQTGLTGEFDVNLKWNPENDPQRQNLEQAVLDQLGLEVVPGTAPVDMLVVRRADN